MYVPGGEPSWESPTKPKSEGDESEEDAFDSTVAAVIFLLLFGVVLLVEHFLIEGLPVLLAGGFLAAAMAIAIATALKS